MSTSTDKPRIILPNPAVIPAELGSRRQWVAWRYKHDGGKLPLDAKTGKAASVTNPSTWSDFPVAYRFALTRRCGIGFVLARDDDFVGLDFDNCIDEHGNIDAATYDILQTLSSYSEVSPSSWGIKTIVRANLARAYKNERIEIYPHSRFFCITGQVVPGLPTSIRDAQDAVDALIREHFPGNGHSSAPLPGRIAEGARNTTLASLAGSLRRRGLPENVIEATLLSVNEHQCDPPLPEAEVKRIAASVARYESALRTIRNDRVQTDLQEFDAADLVSLGAPQEPESYPLLDQPGYIIQGWSHIVAGLPKAGKTELIFTCVRHWLQSGVVKQALWLSEESRNIWQQRLAKLRDFPRGLHIVTAIGVD